MSKLVARTTWYFVSTDPEQLVVPDNRDDQTEFPHYRSQGDAIEAIENDDHGETGTLYVIKAVLSVAATAHRSWTLVRGERPTPDPEPTPPFGGLYEPRPGDG